jgi:P4 family phage/plasmid primase-like protien
MQSNSFSIEETTRFLNILEEGGRFTFQTLDDKKSGAPLIRTLHGTLEEHVEELKRLNSAGAGVFVTVNKTNGAGRKASDIVKVRAHFIDSDDAPILEVCAKIPIKPHILVETSEGKGHAYFLVSDTPLAEFTHIQDQLRLAFGTDPAVTDLPRLMRLPGFFHNKQEARLVRLIHVEEGQTPFSKKDILNALPPTEPEIKGQVIDLALAEKVDSSIPLSDGYRTNGLTSLVGKWMSEGKGDKEIYELAEDWNSRNTPPLPEVKVRNTIDSIRRTDQRNHPARYGHELQYTDAGNSKRLVSIHGEDIRFDHDRKEWLIWDDRRWVWDATEEIKRKAMKTAAAIYAGAVGLTSPAEIGKITQWAKQSLSARGIQNMVPLAQIDPSVATTSSRLDWNDWALNVSNGTIDLKDYQFRPHSRDDLNTKMAHVAYEPGANCPSWLEFLNTIFKSDEELISWLQKVAGYALTGFTDEQCVYFLIGDGCNGKTTFLNVHKAIMGDYAIQALPDTFMVSRFNAAGGARSDLMRLAGARMAVASEGEEGQRLAESLIKQVTGGEEISTRGLYQKNQIEFKPKFKLFFCSNHKPMIRGTDYGIWRRIRIIPFSVIIPEGKRDPNMLTKLCKEASGILNWAYEGCIRWQAEGLNDIPAVVERASKDYQGENDVIGRFLAECCEDGGKVYSSDLYRAYRDWSEANGEDKKRVTEFGHYLERNKYRKQRDKHGNCWSGLKLIEGKMANVE